jgi:hypothetical protein
MAILVQNVFPVEVTIALIDAVTDDMGVDSEVPPGAVMHVHFERDGLVHAVDVWESPEAYQQFVESTLLPTMGKVAAAQGLDISKVGPPETSITEVHRLVH